MNIRKYSGLFLLVVGMDTNAEIVTTPQGSYAIERYGSQTQITGLSGQGSTLIQESPAGWMATTPGGNISVIDNVGAVNRAPNYAIDPATLNIAPVDVPGRSE